MATAALLPTASGGGFPGYHPFQFRSRRTKLDWRQLTRLDLDRIQSEVDIEALEPHLDNLAYAKVTKEDLHWFSEEDFLQLQRVQQMVVEYLIYVQEHLHARNVSLEAALEAAHAQLQEQADYIGALEEQLRRRRLETEHAVSSGALAQCPCCLKAFSSFEYLDAHLHRRHRNEAAAIIASRPAVRAGQRRAPPPSEEQVEEIIEGVRSSTRREIEAEVKAEVSEVLEKELHHMLQHSIAEELEAAGGTPSYGRAPRHAPSAAAEAEARLSVQTEALRRQMEQMEVRMSAAAAAAVSREQIEAVRDAARLAATEAAAAAVAELGGRVAAEARLAVRHEVAFAAEEAARSPRGRGLREERRSRLGELRDEDEPPSPPPPPHEAAERRAREEEARQLARAAELEASVAARRRAEAEARAAAEAEARAAAAAAAAGAEARARAEAEARARAAEAREAAARAAQEQQAREAAARAAQEQQAREAAAARAAAEAEAEAAAARRRVATPPPPPAAAATAAAAAAPPPARAASPPRAAPIREAIRAAFPDAEDAEEFAGVRARLRQLGGAPAVRAELEATGAVEAGVLCAPPPLEDEADARAIGKYSERFSVVRNSAEADDHWSSDDPAWKGRAAMSRRHRMLVLRDPAWVWFNVAALGLGSSQQLVEAVELLEDMEAAAKTYAANAGGWSDNLGLYFHVYGHAEVEQLQLHLVDLDAVGPTFDELSYKNLPLQTALEVLREELADARESGDLPPPPAARLSPPPPADGRTPSPAPRAASPIASPPLAIASPPSLSPRPSVGGSPQFIRPIPVPVAPPPAAPPRAPSPASPPPAPPPAAPPPAAPPPAAPPPAAPPPAPATVLQRVEGAVQRAEPPREMNALASEEDRAFARALRARMAEQPSSEWSDEQAATLAQLESDLSDWRVAGRETLSAEQLKVLLEKQRTEFEGNPAFENDEKADQRKQVLEDLEKLTRAEYVQPDLATLRRLPVPSSRPKSGR